jgi:hypothetical protein
MQFGDVNGFLLAGSLSLAKRALAGRWLGVEPRKVRIASTEGRHGCGKRAVPRLKFSLSFVLQQENRGKLQSVESL